MCFKAHLISILQCISAIKSSYKQVLLGDCWWSVWQVDDAIFDRYFCNKIDFKLFLTSFLNLIFFFVKVLSGLFKTRNFSLSFHNNFVEQKIFRYVSKRDNYNNKCFVKFLNKHFLNKKSFVKFKNDFFSLRYFSLSFLTYYGTRNLSISSYVTFLALEIFR